jgi:hypothetical protein
MSHTSEERYQVSVPDAGSLKRAGTNNHCRQPERNPSLSRKNRQQPSFPANQATLLATDLPEVDRNISYSVYLKGEIKGWV